MSHICNFISCLKIIKIRILTGFVLMLIVPILRSVQKCRLCVNVLIAARKHKSKKKKTWPRSTPSGFRKFESQVSVFRFLGF
jgi:hypothetical protein